MDNVMFLTVRNSEGALERLLRVTRHRGFAIDSLLVQNGRDPSLYEVTLRLSMRTAGMPKAFASATKSGLSDKSISL